MQIRLGTPEDATKLAQLEAEIFGNTAWSYQTLLDELQGEHRTYYVLEDHTGEIAGYAGLLVIGDDADVQTIAVAAKLRGLGYGKMLLAELLGRAAVQQAKQIFLEVRQDNPAAINLYEANGFKTIATRQGYYQPDNVAALVMRKNMTLVLKGQQ